MNTLNLPSIDDIERSAVYFHSLKIIIVHRIFWESQKLAGLVAKFLNLMLSHSSCMLALLELSGLHKHFEHPVTNEVTCLPNVSKLVIAGPETWKVLKSLKNECDLCRIYAHTVFNFTLQDETVFNSTARADIVYIESKSVFHVLHKTTNFRIIGLLENMSSKTTWSALKMC